MLAVGHGRGRRVFLVSNANARADELLSAFAKRDHRCWRGRRAELCVIVVVIVVGAIKREGRYGRECVLVLSHIVVRHCNRRHHRCILIGGHSVGAGHNAPIAVVFGCDRCARHTRDDIPVRVKEGDRRHEGARTALSGTVGRDGGRLIGLPTEGWQVDWRSWGRDGGDLRTVDGHGGCERWSWCRRGREGVERDGWERQGREGTATGAVGAAVTGAHVTHSSCGD